jgi:hypothetical protein
LMNLDAYSKEDPLILLTDFPADAKGGGAVILRSLLPEDERDRVLWLTLSGNAQSDPNVWAGQVRLSRGSAGRGKRSVLLDSLYHAGALADEVLALAQDRGARAIWVVLHGAAVQVAAHLARRGTLPIHATVHDDPPFECTLRSRRLCFLLPLVARDFSFALRKATSVDVVSRPMADRYRRRYGVEAQVVHRGLDAGVIKPSPAYDPVKFGLTVGILGSTYSYRQLPLLATAVGKAAKELQTFGRVVILGHPLYAQRLKKEFDGRVQVEVMGHLDEAAAVPELQACFLLYLNYPFSWPHRVLRQTSFPTKLSTYIMASRPLLIHAPRDSTTMALNSTGPYFRHWGTDNADDAKKLLLECWRDPAMRESFHQAANAVRAQFYDLPTNRQRLFAMLNLLPGTSPSSRG